MDAQCLGGRGLRMWVVSCVLAAAVPLLIGGCPNPNPTKPADGVLAGAWAGDLTTTGRADRRTDGKRLLLQPIVCGDLLG